MSLVAQIRGAGLLKFAWFCCEVYALEGP